MLGRLKKAIVDKVNGLIHNQVIALSDVQKKDFTSRNIQVMKNTLISNDTEIGDYTYIGFNCTVSKSRIGRYCSIASNVSIGHGEHVIKNVSTSSLFYEDAYATLTEGECVIGHDVWIGVDSIIRRGITIGNGAVIGANSFVNQDIPPFAIAVGSPAKVVKLRFEPDAVEIINGSGWWNLPLEEAKRVIKKLGSEIHHG